MKKKSPNIQKRGRKKGGEGGLHFHTHFKNDGEPLWQSGGGKKEKEKLMP